MHRKKHISSFCSFLTLAAMAFPGPVFGFGIVSDVTSYTYYVEQIAQYSEQINEMKEMVSTAQKTLDSAEDAVDTANKTYNQLTGTYYQAERYINRFKRIDKMLDQNPRTLQGKYNKWMSIGKAGTDLADDTVNLYEDPEKGIDLAYRDPRDPMYKHVEEMDKRYEIEQTALKNSVGEAQSVLAGTQGRMKNIHTLMDSIKDADNPKKAQDHTNTLLGEILLVLDQLLVLTAHMVEAEGLINYSGVDDSLTDKRVEIINTRAGRARERNKALHDGFRKMAADSRRNAQYSIEKGEI